MKEMNKENLIIILGAEAVRLAEQVKWSGDLYTHPCYGVCKATFFNPSPYAQTEIVCLYRQDDLKPCTYAILLPD